jgi:DNA-binding NtrC family response regulator
MVERLVALTEGDVIRFEDLPPAIAGQRRAVDGPCIELTEQGIDLVDSLAAIEKALIAQAITMAGGVKARAAALLGINRTTLVEKMKRFSI